MEPGNSGAEPSPVGMVGRGRSRGGGAWMCAESQDGECEWAGPRGWGVAGEGRGIAERRGGATRSPSRPAGAERVPQTWDRRLIAQFSRPGLGGPRRSAPAAIPMGLCFPCPTEAAPPSPDLVSKAACPLPRVSPPAPRAPVPGGARREARAAAPGQAVGLGGAGRRAAGGEPAGRDGWLRPEGPRRPACGIWGLPARPSFCL